MHKKIVGGISKIWQMWLVLDVGGVCVALAWLTTTVVSSHRPDQGIRQRLNSNFKVENVWAAAIGVRANFLLIPSDICSFCKYSTR